MKAASIRSADPSLSEVDFRGVRALVLDLDDTLCAYWEAAKAGLRAAFSAHGPEEVPIEALWAAWAQEFRSFCPRLRELGLYATYLETGEPTRTELMRRTLRAVGREDEERAAALSRAYREARRQALRLFPEARAFVADAAARFPLGMITNGPADIQREEVRDLELEAFFDPLLIEGEVGFGKPHPEIFRLVERRLGLSGPALLMVGNSYSSDIRPAIEAGWRTAWVRRPTDLPPSAAEEYPEERPPEAPAPDLEIGDLDELRPLLGLPPATGHV